MIKKISFEVETITPMFLSGANQGKAELRAASIKGLLRYWWRALQAESDLGELRKKESGIFGSSDKNFGGAKFSIRVTQPDKKQLLNFKTEITHQNKIREQGIGYLLYSTFMQRGKERPYYPAGSKFTITFSSQGGEYLQIATASLWALVHFGGLGTRARRGAGNIAISSVEDTQGILNNTKLDFIAKGDNSDEAAKWLTNNFEVVKSIVSNGSTIFVSEYTNLSFSRFIIGNSDYASWKEALNDAGSVFKSFRGKNKSRIFESAVFGFPVIHRRTTVTGKAGNESFDRRSSPIIFKVIKVHNQYYWTIIRLAGELLPESGVIKADRSTQKPDYGILDEFWSEIKEIGREHILSMPDTLRHLTEEIKQEVDLKKILLFGSKARGDFHSHSDTDIAVDTEKPLANLSLPGAVDIVSCRKTDEKLKEKIEKEGVVIYERKS